MIILGIDPGSARVGFGLIKTGRNLELIDYGTIEAKADKTDIQIKKIIDQLSKILNDRKPDLVSIEKIYFSKNVKTGIAVAQTRGAMISEISKFQIPIKELSPSEIKLSVTGYGLADKKAVAKMVSRILRIEKVRGFDDASDALAIAIAAIGNNG